MSCSTGDFSVRGVSRAALIIITAGIALGSAPAIAASFVEPVFGLLVDGAKARYQPLAPDVAKRCNLASPHLVFAFAKDKGGDLYLVQPASGEGAGAVLRVAPATCASAEAVPVLSGQAAPPGAGMAQTVAVQSGAVQSGAGPLPKALLDDAVLRGQQANGGPVAFKAKVCQPAVMRDIEAYPAVRARLGVLCGM